MASVTVGNLNILFQNGLKYLRLHSWKFRAFFRYTGGKIKMSVSPTNLNNIQTYLAKILDDEILQMCVQNTFTIQQILNV